MAIDGAGGQTRRHMLSGLGCPAEDTSDIVDNETDCSLLRTAAGYTTITNPD